MPETSGESNDEVTEWLTELLYTGVGLGILAINRLQVARHSAEKHLQEKGLNTGSNPGIDAITELLADPDKLGAVLRRLKGELTELDSRLDGLEDHFTGLLRRLEPELPEAARELSVAVRKLTNDHSEQVRSMLGLEAR